MKLSNKIFVGEFVPSLRVLLQTKLPAVYAFKLAKFARQVEEKGAIFEKARLGIAEGYGEKGKDGNYKIPAKNMEKAQKEFDELLALTEEYDIEQMVLPDTVEIEPVHLLNLELIIKLQ